MLFGICSPGQFRYLLNWIQSHWNENLYNCENEIQHEYEFSEQRDSFLVDLYKQAIFFIYQNPSNETINQISFESRFMKFIIASNLLMMPWAIWSIYSVSSIISPYTHATEIFLLINPIIS